MRRILTKVTSFFLLACMSQFVSADSYSDSISEFEAFKNTTDSDFSEYKQQLQDAFTKYNAEAAKVWGVKNNLSSDKRRLISYLGGLNHRSIIDFEKGIVNVEVAIPVSDNLSDDKAHEKLKKTILTTLVQGTDTRSIIEIAKQPVSVLSGEPLLNNLVANNHGEIVRNSNYEKLADKLANNANKKMINGADGKSRFVFTTQFSLVPDHIRKRALVYQDIVSLNAQEHRISAALIYAIIETESMFNPNARSPAPAFGLMQLVPTTGARDAYRYLYNRDRLVNDTYLYKPENNIRLGTAYLNRLYYSYFKDVKNMQSRQWVSVASYNTGMGNVYAAFAGKYSRSGFASYKQWKAAAFHEINKRTPEQVYNFLRRNLSKREGREYVKKVRSKLSKYQSV